MLAHVSVQMDVLADTVPESLKIAIAKRNDVFVASIKSIESFITKAP